MLNYKKILKIYFKIALSFLVFFAIGIPMLIYFIRPKLLIINSSGSTISNVKLFIITDTENSYVLQYEEIANNQSKFKYFNESDVYPNTIDYELDGKLFNKKLDGIITPVEKFKIEIFPNEIETGYY